MGEEHKVGTAIHRPMKEHKGREHSKLTTRVSKIRILIGNSLEEGEGLGKDRQFCGRKEGQV